MWNPATAGTVSLNAEPGPKRRIAAPAGSDRGGGQAVPSESLGFIAAVVLGLTFVASGLGKL